MKNTAIKNQFFFAFGGFFLFFFVILPHTAQALAATITLTPNTPTISANQTVKLSIDEDSSSDPVNAVQFTLNLPANKVSNVSIDTMNSGFSVQAQNSQTNGQVKIARGTITPVSGQKHIVTVDFTAKTNLSLSEIQLADAFVVRSTDHKNIYTPSSGSETTGSTQDSQSSQPVQSQPSHENNNTSTNPPTNNTTTQYPNSQSNAPTNQQTSNYNDSSLPIPSITIVASHHASPTIFSIIADFFKSLFGGK